MALARRWRIDAWLLGATGAALVARLAAVVAWGAHRAPELWEYETIADNVLAGRGFVYDSVSGGAHWSHVEPLYPLLTAGVYALTGHSHLVMALVNAVLSTLLVPLAWTVAMRLGGVGPARLAAILTAADPGLVRYAVKFHPLALDALGLMGVLALALWLRERLDVRAHVWFGLAAGACVLTRPTVLVFLPVAWSWLVALSPGRRRRRVGLIAISVVVAAVTISPWVARNYAVHGRFVLTRTNGPYVFWLGNNPHWTGTSVNADGNALFEGLPAALRERIVASPELAQNDLLREEAWRYVRADPAAFAGRIAWRFAHFWLVPVQSGLLYRSEPLGVYRVFYWTAAAAAGLGLLALASGGRGGRSAVANGVLVVGFLAAISLIQSAFFVETRHRLALEPALLALAALGVAWGADRLRAPNRTALRWSRSMIGR